MICTEKEIVTIEQEIGRVFPAEYRRYLLSPPPSLEFDVNVHNHPGERTLLREIANHVLWEDQEPPLSPEMFPFFTYQDDFFSAFRWDAGDDPPTILHVPLVGVKTFAAFTLWIEHMVDKDAEPEDDVGSRASPKIRKLAKNCLEIWNCAEAAGGRMRVSVKDPDPINTMLCFLQKGITVQQGLLKGTFYQVPNLKAADFDLLRRHIVWIGSEEFDEGYFEFRP